MKAVIFAMLVVSVPALAAGRSTLGLSCQNAAEIVASNGAVVLSTGPGLYDRYVSSSYYCATGETTVPAWVPTRDSRQCFIGYTCAPQQGAE